MKSVKEFLSYRTSQNIWVWQRYDRHETIISLLSSDDVITNFTAILYAFTQVLQDMYGLLLLLDNV